MMEREAPARPNRGLRTTVLAVCALTVFSVVVGFVWLPTAQSDFSAAGLWASICRAAGVPAAWGGAEDRTTGASRIPALRTTAVVLDRAMARPGTNDAIGRGATLALQCAVCHGERGAVAANAPELAGQYPDVLIKQLADYQHGDRISAVMQALARAMSERDIEDLAAYYGYLPAPPHQPPEDEPPPVLVTVGSPMRNIAPCATCHGAVDRKLGAPRLEGMPRQYLLDQMQRFASGGRTNDSHAQMRNMARSMSVAEIEGVARFYGRQGGDGAAR